MKEKIRIMEEKMCLYYSNEEKKECLEHKLELLKRHKQEIESDLKNASGNDITKTLEQNLNEINVQILDANCKLRNLENNFADLNFLINTLSERERKILVHKYKNKKSMKSLSFDFYLTDARLCQLKNKTMVHLYDSLDF